MTIQTTTLEHYDARECALAGRDINDPSACKACVAAAQPAPTPQACIGCGAAQREHRGGRCPDGVAFWGVARDLATFDSVVAPSLRSHRVDEATIASMRASIVQ